MGIHLHCCLAEFILPQTWANLAFIAVAKGPGSFTGTRIGVVTARTLAQQFKLPLFAVSSLAILAWAEAPVAIAQGLAVIAVAMPARSGEVFAAIYQTSKVGLIALFPDTVLTVEEWQQVLMGWSTSYYGLQADSSLSADIACRSLLDLAFQGWQHGERPDWSEALPFYS